MSHVQLRSGFSPSPGTFVGHVLWATQGTQGVGNPGLLEVAR